MHAILVYLQPFRRNLGYTLKFCDGVYRKKILKFFWDPRWFNDIDVGSP